MEKEYTLKLSESDITRIGNTLAELPYKSVADLLTKIAQQMQMQEQTVDPDKSS